MILHFGHLSTVDSGGFADADSTDVHHAATCQSHTHSVSLSPNPVLEKWGVMFEDLL